MLRHIGFALTVAALGIAIIYVGWSAMVTRGDRGFVQQKVEWPHLSSSFGPIQVLNPIY